MSSVCLVISCCAVGYRSGSWSVCGSGVEPDIWGCCAVQSNVRRSSLSPEFSSLCIVKYVCARLDSLEMGVQMIVVGRVISRSRVRVVSISCALIAAAVVVEDTYASDLSLRDFLCVEEKMWNGLNRWTIVLGETMGQHSRGHTHFSRLCYASLHNYQDQASHYCYCDCIYIRARSWP